MIPPSERPENVDEPSVIGGDPAPMPTAVDLFDVALAGANNAMPVLITMLKTAELKTGLVVADEIWGNVKCALKVYREQRHLFVAAVGSDSERVAHRTTEAENVASAADQALEALEFAAGAIIDAIADEDGLDGLAGAHVLQIIDDALIANGRHKHPKPTDDNYEQYARECSLSAMLYRLKRQSQSERPEKICWCRKNPCECMPTPLVKMVCSLCGEDRQDAPCNDGNSDSHVPVVASDRPDDVCQCGDYRREHEKGTGRCLACIKGAHMQPFPICEEFRLVASERVEHRTTETVEQARTLADYRPQHDFLCDTKICGKCGFNYEVCEKYPNAECPKPTRRACTCGLDALIAAVRQEPRTTREEDQEVLGSTVRDWQQAALILGEHLATTGPTGYYGFTPTQWLDWARNTLLTVSRQSRQQDQG